MSTIDLIVLGILFNEPRNAYELVRFIRERRVDRVLKVSAPAVFKSCRRLAEAGFIDGETVRDPRVPDKVVYRINHRGRERLYQLLTYFAREVKPYFFDFNTVIWGIDRMEPSQGRELLRNLQQQLHQIKGGVIAHEQEVGNSLPFGPRQIVKQYRMTITALAQWIDELIVDFETLHELT